MKRLILSLAAAATLFVGTLATPNTAEAQRGRFRAYSYGPSYYGGYRPYYGGYTTYRPYYGGYNAYRPYYGGYNTYRPYYGGYYSRPYSYGYYPGYRPYYGQGYYYGSPGYYSTPDVRIGAGPVGVRLF